MDPLHFQCTLKDSGGGPIKIPHDVRALFGHAKPPVPVTIRAGREHTYRSTVAAYGDEYCVPLNKADAAAAAITPRTNHSTSDNAPRVVTVPDDLAAALDTAGLRDRWNELSYTRQREHAEGSREPSAPRLVSDGSTRRLSTSVATAPADPGA